MTTYRILGALIEFVVWLLSTIGLFTVGYGVIYLIFKVYFPIGVFEYGFAVTIGFLYVLTHLNEQMRLEQDQDAAELSKAVHSHYSTRPRGSATRG